jgi:hypothetical protein
VKRWIILSLLIILALAACAGHDEAVTAKEAEQPADPVLLEVMADHQYVLLIAHVDDVAQVDGGADWMVVTGLADGDRVEVRRAGGDVFEVFPLGQ